MKTEYEPIKQLGFGYMRIPFTNGDFDYEEICKMVDIYINSGFNYFDTAFGYARQKAEKAIKHTLVERYERSQFLLADKLTECYIDQEQDIVPFFLKQLENCGVEYFDYYFLHAITKEYYEKFVRCNAFEVLKKLKQEGKIRHIGISYHDSAHLLDQILNEHPEIEVVQIQFNFIDYDDPVIQSNRNYEVVRKHKLPVFIMEPLKGGSVIKIAEASQEICIDSEDIIKMAFRFCASFSNVAIILSGMNNKTVVEENCKFFRNISPLTKDEFEQVAVLRESLKKKKAVQCTFCQYCKEQCPVQMPIPELIAAYNSKIMFKGWNSKLYYNAIISDGKKPSECIGCGLCEKRCPQHLKIRNILKNITGSFEKKK